MYASEGGHEGCLRLLIAAGASVHNYIPEKDEDLIFPASFKTVEELFAAPPERKDKVHECNDKVHECNLSSAAG